MMKRQRFTFTNLKMGIFVNLKLLRFEEKKQNMTVIFCKF